MIGLLGVLRGARGRDELQEATFHGGQRQKQKQCCASEDEEGKALGLNTSDYQLFNGQTTHFLSFYHVKRACP